MNAKRVFGCPHDFLGRESELERIIAAAHAGQSLTVLAAPGVGASELLRQVYDELFLSESLVPFYFELKRSDRDAASAARRFAHQFLIQSVAYTRQDPQLIAVQPSLNEICRLAPADLDWIDGAVESLLSGGSISSNVGIPARARRRIALLIDGLDSVRLIREGSRFLEAVASLRGISIIASGRRRAMYGRMPGGQMRLEPLPFAELTKVVAALAQERDIEIADATRDLVAVQTAGSLKVVDLLLAQALDDGEALNAFATVERVYTNSIFGGRIGRYLRDKLFRPLPKDVDPNVVVRLLSETLNSEGMRLPIQHWRRALREVDDGAFGRLIRHLHVEEALAAGDGTVSMAATPRVVRDYIEARGGIIKHPKKRAITVGRAMQHNTSRAARLMTEFYRSNAAIGVRQLLDIQHGQSVARAAVEYALFKRELKGQSDEAIVPALRTSADRIDLPRTVYTADASAFYAPLSEFCDRDRAAIGLTESGEAWLVAEIDSKLEADTATAEFWCDRLEMAALNSGLDRYQIWLIAPEGFADDALQILAERSAFGSSRRQAVLLRELLLSPPPLTETDTATKYEITVEMGDEGELIAARMFGEVAEKHSIPLKTGIQVKTALIEALINAAEHSLSADRNVDLTFTVSPESIKITVVNRGLKLTEHMLSQEDAPSERRGWGLKLIRELMDEVHVDPTDDGTRLVMIKHLKTS
ncbi:MAG: ATP-binding protein [Pyrinomonadaceae bacterium]